MCSSKLPFVGSAWVFRVLWGSELKAFPTSSALSCQSGSFSDVLPTSVSLDKLLARLLHTVVHAAAKAVSARTKCFAHRSVYKPILPHQARPKDTTAPCTRWWRRLQPLDTLLQASSLEYLGAQESRLNLQCRQ